MLSRVSLNRLQAHHGARSEAVPEKVLRAFQNGIELRFHSAPRLQDVVERYQQLREKTLASLEAASSQINDRQSPIAIQANVRATLLIDARGHMAGTPRQKATNQ
jgi:hypothetical protein